jgi:hypothetical protein
VIVNNYYYLTVKYLNHLLLNNVNNIKIILLIKWNSVFTSIIRIYTNSTQKSIYNLHINSISVMFRKEISSRILQNLHKKKKKKKLLINVLFLLKDKNG